MDPNCKETVRSKKVNVWLFLPRIQLLIVSKSLRLICLLSRQRQEYRVLDPDMKLAKECVRWMLIQWALCRVVESRRSMHFVRTSFDLWVRASCKPWQKWMSSRSHILFIFLVDRVIVVELQWLSLMGTKNLRKKGRKSLHELELHTTGNFKWEEWCNFWEHWFSWITC